MTTKKNRVQDSPINTAEKLFERRQSRNLIAEDQKRMLRVFKNFCNIHLGKIGRKINDLRDISTGVELYYLLKVLAANAGIPITFTVEEKRLENKFVQRNNVQKNGLKLHGVNSVSIVGKEVSIVMGFMWQIILFYHIRFKDTENLSAYQRLVDWVNKRIKPLKINQLKDWKSGEALFRLIETLAPNKKHPFFNENRGNANKKQLVENCIEFSHKYMRIPKIVTAEEFLNPERQTLSTYLGFFKEFTEKGMGKKQVSVPDKILELEEKNAIYREQIEFLKKKFMKSQKQLQEKDKQLKEKEKEVENLKIKLENVAKGTKWREKENKIPLNYVECDNVVELLLKCDGELERLQQEMFNVLTVKKEKLSVKEQSSVTGRMIELDCICTAVGKELVNNRKSERGVSGKIKQLHRGKNEKLIRKFKFGRKEFYFRMQDKAVRFIEKRKQKKEEKEEPNEEPDEEPIKEDPIEE